jgi:WD40 repeat protein
MLLTGGQDGAARVWDLRTGKPAFQPFRVLGAIGSVAFRSDNRAFAVWSDKGTWVYQLPTPVPGEVERIRLWVQVITGKEMDASGIVSVLDGDAWHARRERLTALGGPPITLPEPAPPDPELNTRLAKLDPDVAAAEFPAVSYAQTWKLPQQPDALDSALFQAKSHPDVQVAHAVGGWQLNIPADGQNRDRFGRLYLPVVEGDFQITMTYRPLAFAAPKRPHSNLIALVVKSVLGAGDKTVTWHRNHQPGAAKPGMALYDAGGGGLNELELPPGTGEVERVRLTRHREYVKAEWSRGPAEPFREVGRVRCDRAAVVPWVEVRSHFTGDEVAVSVSDLTILAARVTPAFDAGAAVRTEVEDFRQGLTPRFNLAPNPLGKVTTVPDGLRMELDTTSLKEARGEAYDLFFADHFAGDVDATLTYSDLSCTVPENGFCMCLINSTDWTDLNCMDPGLPTERYLLRKRHASHSAELPRGGLKEGKLRLIRRGQLVYALAAAGTADQFQLIGVSTIPTTAPYALRVNLYRWLVKDKITVTLNRLEIKVPVEPEKKGGP